MGKSRNSRKGIKDSTQSRSKVYVRSGSLRKNGTNPKENRKLNFNSNNVANATKL